MQFALKFAIYLAVAPTLLVACTTANPQVDVHPPSTKKSKHSTRSVLLDPSSQLVALNQVTGGREDLKNSVRDVRAIIQARQLQDTGDLKGSTQAWYDALRLSRGGFGKIALEGWVKAYANQIGRASDISSWTHAIMTETHDGSISAYMKTAGLTKDDHLKPLLKSWIPQWISSDAEAKPNNLEKPQLPPVAWTSGDPLLLKTAAVYCQRSRPKDDSWKTWQQSLNTSVIEYWQGLVAQLCGPGPGHAAAIFQKVYPKLAEDRTTQGMAVEAASRCVTLQRAVGQRIEAADTYSDLVELWGNPGVTAASMGQDSLGLTIRRIDETLWAARYRALIGDLERAKVFAKGGLRLAIDTLRQNSPQIKKAQRNQITSLIADAYHTLASRVAIELGHYRSAVSLAALAAKTPGVNDQWRERLGWSVGIYEYLDGNFAGALSTWQKVQATTQDEALKVAASFWQARCLERLGRIAEAEIAIADLISRYPLSYYSVVAVSESGTMVPGEWEKSLGNIASFSDNLSESRDYHLKDLRDHQTIGPLLKRAEILVAAGLPQLAKIAIAELETELAAHVHPKANQEAYVYLSRLQYRSGSYLAAINLTGRLAKLDPDFWQTWPEQLLIYFPQPYSEVFERQSRLTSTPKSLLLGISRQESGFTPDIRSSANAVGIMQLIAPTAKKYAPELGIPIDNIEDRLRDPNTNIILGSQYLKTLSQNYQGLGPAIYGSYNAGEFAMDAWLKRRPHNDLLLFVELVPFGETRDYIKSVWRNVAVYDRLSALKVGPTEPGLDLGFAGHEGA